MRVPKIEDVTVVEVGKFYNVPVGINPRSPRRLQVIPLLGPYHDDQEFINFPWKHYHPDRRFVTEAWLRHQYAHWSIVYTFVNNTGATGFRLAGRRRMKCLRLVGSFERISKTAGPLDIPWLPDLEKAYCGEKLRDNLICPHRGISCVGVIAESDGGVVCPGHGLKWNPKTGEMISRIVRS